MKIFSKIFKGFQLLTVFLKTSILDVWQGSEYASVINVSQFLLFIIFFIYLMTSKIINLWLNQFLFVYLYFS